MTAPFPTGGSYYRYRDEVYRATAVADDWVGLALDGRAPTPASYPDALEFHDGDDPWVTIPTSALEAAYTRRVDALWRGAPVAVASRVRRGPTRGKLLVEYTGSHPDEAVAAGFEGDQYNGWGAEVDESELQIVKDVYVERPVDPR